MQGAGPARPGPSPGGSAAAGSPGPRQHRYQVCFEYVGRTALTAIGGATGRRYRFEGPGARVVVDPRDRPSLAQVPTLRQV